jgi:hypothetical protein
MGRACSTNENENAYRMLVGKPEGNNPVRKPRLRWSDNFKMALRNIGWSGIDLAQDRDQWRALVNMVMNLRLP